MRRTLPLAAMISWGGLALALPASAQDQPGHAGHGADVGEQPAAGEMPDGRMDHDDPDHGDMDHADMDDAQMDHAQMDHAEPSSAHAPMDHAMHHADASAGSGDPNDTPGDAPPPQAPTDHAADAVFPRSVMERSRAELYGDMRFATFSAEFEKLEYRFRKGADGYAFEGGAWYGGDLDRGVFYYEGEGAFGEPAETIELGAYWRRAINPWFNLQLGARHDVRPDPQRTYAMIGIEGLAPYWIETQLRAYVSDRGDVHMRAEASYDQRITQRLVLEPEVELDLAMQDVPELGIRSGFSGLELSARLRYEIARNFAPYIGFSWERRFGESADQTAADDHDIANSSLVAGVRFWF